MKKKVLMSASVYGHIRSFHLPYLQEFQRLGWETHVACAGIPAEIPYVDRALDLPFEKKLTAPSNFKAMRMLRRYIAQEQFNLIITHTTLAAFFTRLAVKGMKDRPRLVNVMHGYLFDDETPFLKRELMLNAERLTAPETDLLLTMNEWDFQAAKKYRLGKQIEKIPGMGVDFSRLDTATEEDSIRLKKALDIPAEAFVLIYPAEFSRRKSQHVLIEAMRYLPEQVWLVLCGEGDQLMKCKELAEKLSVQDRILFPGQITDIAPWYRMADALVASSRSEGLPFNVMEAMYMGLPVVASAVKGHTDLIQDGETGLLYPYGDSEKCADYVCSLVNDRALCATVGHKASDDANAYSISTVLQQNMRKYSSVS